MAFDIKSNSVLPPTQPTYMFWALCFLAQNSASDVQIVTNATAEAEPMMYNMLNLYCFATTGRNRSRSARSNRYRKHVANRIKNQALVELCKQPFVTEVAGDDLSRNSDFEELRQATGI